MSRDSPLRFTSKHAGHRDSTSARTASQRFPRATLPNAHVHIIGSIHADKFNIGPPWKSGVTLDFGSQAQDLLVRNGINVNNAVRILQLTLDVIGKRFRNDKIDANPVFGWA